MLVKCSLCGGDNAVHPGQKMLLCAYCGSALAIRERGGPEHLILPHERDDKLACDVLRSCLLSRDRPHPKEMKTDFAFVPFLLVEDEEGRTRTVLATDQYTLPAEVQHPPAGNYRFFEAEPPSGERIVPAGRAEKGTTRILHLPVYTVRYACGGSKWEAAVIGESWQVVAGALPDERSVTFNARNLLAAFGLFTLYLLIGKLAPGWPGRLALIFVTAAAAFSVLSIRRKVLGRE